MIKFSIKFVLIQLYYEGLCILSLQPATLAVHELSPFMSVIIDAGFDTIYDPSCFK